MAEGHCCVSIRSCVPARQAGGSSEGLVELVVRPPLILQTFGLPVSHVGDDAGQDRRGFSARIKRSGRHRRSGLSKVKRGSSSGSVSPTMTFDQRAGLSHYSVLVPRYSPQDLRKGAPEGVPAPNCQERETGGARGLLMVVRNTVATVSARKQQPMREYRSLCL